MSWLLLGKTVSDPNAVWAAYYTAQGQPYTYPAAVQPTIQSVTGQQQAAAAPYAALSRATVTPQPSTYCTVLFYLPQPSQYVLHHVILATAQYVLPHVVILSKQVCTSLTVCRLL